MSDKSYVKNCIVEGRESDGPLFVEKDGFLYVYLDGYAIIPLEKYEQFRCQFATVRRELNLIADSPTIGKTGMKAAARRALAALDGEDQTIGSVPVMNDKLMFDQAFSIARASGALLFDWQGKTYTTKLHHELKEPEIEPKIVRWREGQDNG